MTVEMNVCYIILWFIKENIHFKVNLTLIID